MKQVGIIAEYNPFHTGHGHHIAETRQKIWDTYQEECGVVVVMSGHWVQQARCAVADKWLRGRLAVEGGADLVLELPTLWATSSAQGFARGAVEVLEGSGVVTHLSFGSECGDISVLEEIADGLSTEAFSQQLKQTLKEGVSFPTARQKALEQVLGQPCLALKSPNNTLGIEYISALQRISSGIQPMTVSRKGGGFHSLVGAEEPRPVHTSATDLREKMEGDQWDYVKAYLSPAGQAYFQENPPPSLVHCERIFLEKCCSMTAEDWSKLPDSGEGLADRLEKIGHRVSSVAEFLEQAKTKRYTHARLRRLMLWAFLGLKQEDIPEKPPYLRVIACNAQGRKMLAEMREKAHLPVLTKTAQIHGFSQECQSVFGQEVKFTDLYGICFPKIQPRGLEWRMPPVIL